MLTLKDFIKSEESIIKEEISNRLSVGDKIELGSGITIKTEQDLERTVVKNKIKNLSKQKAKKNFKEASVDVLRFVLPSENSHLNEIPLQNGVYLPIYANRLVEDIEISSQMIAVGLFLALQAEYNSYYLKLLKSFNTADFPQKHQELIKEWESYRNANNRRIETLFG